MTCKKSVTSVFILLAVAIALLALFVFLPTHSTPAYAENEPTYNSEENVYEINSAAQLLRLAEHVNNADKLENTDTYWASLSYKLTAPIDLAGETWTPIGLGNATFDIYVDVTDTIASLYAREDGEATFNSTWSDNYTEIFIDENGTPASDTYDTTAHYYYRYSAPNAFYGTFDGNFHTISNITFSSDISTYNGLFGFLKNASVSNVVIADSSCATTDTATASSYIGGIAGYVENSDISGCGVIRSTLYGHDYAGGIVGKIQEQRDSFSDIYSSVDSAIKNEIENFLHEAKTSHSISSCYSIKNNIYSDGHSAGILAYADGNTVSQIDISYSYNSSVVRECGSSEEQIMGEQTTVYYGAGILGGCSSTGAIIRYCLGVTSIYDEDTLLYGAISVASGHISCYNTYYVKDDTSDGRQIDPGTPDYSAIHCDLSTLVSSAMTDKLGGNGYWCEGGRTNNTCDYPLPVSCPLAIKDQFEAYTVTEDSVLKQLHFEGFSYTYPFLVRDGYTHLGWHESGEEELIDPETSISVTGNIDILSSWSLNAPTLTLLSSYSGTYSGQMLSFTPSMQHPVDGLTATYEWYKGDDPVWEPANVLEVKNVSDSGVYHCRVTVSDGVLSATSEEKTLQLTIAQKNLSITVRLSMDNAQNIAKKTHTYDGNAIENPLISSTGSVSGHNIVPTFLYFDEQMQAINKNQTTDVGQYTVSAEVAVTDQGEENVIQNYSVTITPYAYEVTPATMVVTCLKPAAATVYYSGTAYTLTSSDFEITTVHGQTPAVDTVGSYSNVVTDGVLSYTVTAPNHNAVNGQITVTILPLELVVNKAPSYSSLTFTKKYNGSTAFDYAPFLSEMGETAWYTLSVASGTFEGELPSVSVSNAVFSQKNVGEDLTLTFTFDFVEDDHENFSLSSNNSKLVYENCSISKKDIFVAKKENTYLLVSKYYDGTTAADGNLSSLLNNKYTVSDTSASVIPVSARYNSALVAEASDLIVQFSIAPSSQNNFVFENEAETYEVVFSGNGRIKKAEVTITKAAVEPIIKTYDKQENATVTADMYTVDTPNGDVMTPTVQSAVYASLNAGSTSITATFTLNDPNYTIADSSVSLVYEAYITPRDVTISNVKAVARTYIPDTTYVDLDGSMATLSGVLSGDTVHFVLSDNGINGGIIDSADVGRYDVLVKENITIDNPNYSLVNPKPTGITVTISKAIPNIHPHLPGGTIAYLEDYLLPEISLTEGDSDGLIDWTNEEVGSIDWIDSLLTDVGDIDLEWNFTPKAPYSANYNEVSGVITVTVIHKEITSLVVYRQPNKLEYTALETFDTNGMIVYVYYNSGAFIRLNQQTLTSTGYTVGYSTPDNVFHYGNSGVDTITLSYSEFNKTLYCGIDVTVNKIIQPLPYVAGTEKTYNGYPLSPVINNTDGNVLLTGTTRSTDCGTFLFTLSLKNTDDYKWADETTEPKEYSWSIYPVGRHLLYVNVTSFVYSGQEMQVTVYNDNNTDKNFFTYTDDSVFSATDAGTYSVTASLISNNYYWIDPENPTDRSDNADKTFSWQILKKVIDKPTLDDKVFVYNERTQTIDLEEKEGYVLSGDLTYTIAKEYTVYADLSSDNYIWRDNSTERYALHYTVRKMPITIPEPAISMVAYNGNTHSVRMSTSRYYTVTGNIQAISAGKYTVTVNLKDASTMWADETSEAKTFNWTILPIYVPKPTVISDNVYNGYEQTANIAYEEIESPYELSGYKAKNVGSYTAHITLKDKVNYRWGDGATEDIALIWRIVKATVDIPEQPDNLLYNGFEQIVNIPLSDAYIVTGNKATNKGTYTATLNLKDTQGYTWSDGTTEPKTYTWGIYGITIVSEGEIAQMSTTYELNQSLDVPTREGYSFAGWYTSPDFSESSRITSVDAVTADTTIYAKWTVAQSTGEELPDLNNGSNKNSSSLSKSSRDKLMAGGIIFGACLVASLLILILGKKRK